MHVIVVILALVSVTGMQIAEASKCACATTNVNIRSGPGTQHSRLGLLTTGKCVTYHYDAARSDYVWAVVTYNGQTAYIAKNWLKIQTCGNTVGSTGGSQSGCPTIISRAEWGASRAKSTSYLANNRPKVVVHHSAGSRCFSKSRCMSVLRGIQRFHQSDRGWSDIGYNFLVGEDGNVYEGRGWNKIGAHARGQNSQAYGICVMGNFQTSSPNGAALNAVQRLISCAKSLGKISSGYRLYGHRDVGSTSCPGNNLYSQIRSWPHFG